MLLKQCEWIYDYILGCKIRIKRAPKAILKFWRKELSWHLCCLINKKTKTKTEQKGRWEMLNWSVEIRFPWFTEKYTEWLLFVCSSIQLARVRGLCVYTQFSISLTIKKPNKLYIGTKNNVKWEFKRREHNVNNNFVIYYMWMSHELFVYTNNNTNNNNNTLLKFEPI